MTVKQIEKVFTDYEENGTFAGLKTWHRVGLINALTRLERLYRKGVPAVQQEETCIAGGHSDCIYTIVTCADLCAAGATSQDLEFFLRAGAYLADHNGEMTVHFLT